MAQDDVTTGKALRGGRQKANHIQVHRIEAGLWERKNLIAPMAESAQAVNEMRKFLFVATPIAAFGAVYVAYKIGQAAYEWVDDYINLKDAWEYFVYGNDGKFFFWDKDGNFSL